MCKAKKNIVQQWKETEQPRGWKDPPFIHRTAHRGLSALTYVSTPVLPSDWPGSLRGRRPGGHAHRQVEEQGIRLQPDPWETRRAGTRPDGEHDGAEPEPAAGAGRRPEEQPRTCQTPGEGLPVSLRQVGGSEGEGGGSALVTSCFGKLRAEIISFLSVIETLTVQWCISSHI